jgi:hypothetical protein
LNNPINQYDLLGLVAIRIVKFTDKTNLGYYDKNGLLINNKTVRMGKDGKYNINGFGGFIVYPQPATCYCDGCSRPGTVKLVQLKYKGNHQYIVDTDKTDMGEYLKKSKGYVNDDGDKRVLGYIEDKGRAYPRYSEGYIDAPGLEIDESKIILKSSIRQYEAYFKVEAYCSCDRKDLFLNQVLIFYVTRFPYSKNIELIQLYHGRSNYSDYPTYIEPVKKGVYPW